MVTGVLALPRLIQPVLYVTPETGLGEGGREQDAGRMVSRPKHQTSHQNMSQENFSPEYEPGPRMWTKLIFRVSDMPLSE